MNSKLKIVVEAVAGAAGGFLAWALIELWGALVPRWSLVKDTPEVVSSAWDWWTIVLFGAVMGCLISAFIGAVEGLSTGSRRQLRRSVLTGAAVGLAGGMVGLYWGQIVFARLQPHNQGGALAVDVFAFVRSVAARAIGWGFVGVAIGFAQGVATWSPRKMRHGAVGGAIGGFLGGMMFDFIGEILQVGGAPSRLVGMTLTGGAIGFFLGLVQDLMKQAWVVVLRGRNEGREYVLDKAVSVLGRDELADVGVFGDPSVAAHHAAIKVEGGAYFIEDLGASASGTLVNGQRVSRQGLAEGDTIQLGSTQIVFHEKAGAAPVRRARDVIRPAVSRGPAGDSMCAFCGQAKDPQTGACACTPVAPPATGFGVPTSAQPQAAGFGAAAPVAAGSAFGMPGAVAGGGARLVCADGPMAGQVFPIPDTGATIGREVGRDIVLAGDATVSRRHAIVRMEAGGYVIADEGSSNGTYVNGARIGTQPLRSGDRIRIGQSEFVFEAGGVF